jgi:AraC-like DNA-binding protein
MNFVSASIYHKALQLALEEGLPVEVIENTIVKDRDVSYLPVALLWDIYLAASIHLREGFSIRLGQRMEAEDYGTLGLSWKTCWTARDILDRTARYMVLVTNHGSIQISEKDRLSCICLNRDPVNKALELSNETTFAMFTKIIRDVTASNIHPALVTFKHPPPGTIGLYESFFKCSVIFGHDENTLHFHNKDLDTPTLKADKSIQKYLIDRMDEEAKGINVHSNELLTDVQLLIREALPSGIPSVLQIGRHMGMSGRTLKRRLAENGLTFRSLIQRTQEDIARSLLRNSDCSIGEIAFQAGYSEQSAFNRAFKRWTGQPPLEFRKG